MSEHGISDPLDFIHRQEAINRRDVEITRLEAINADLLAVCEEFLRIMVNDFENLLMYSDGPDQAEVELFEQLEAAIAKARGEQ